MNDLPDIATLLAETQSAFQDVLGTSVGWRDRFGHVTFKECLRANLMLSLLKWSQTEGEGTNADIVAALAKLTEAVYRS
mgnify:CR=1 FL=1|tara:strand:+ start:10169 stop:10405 length:237 start_codon:yes stop_codon:yes gene_type:complete